MGTIVRGLLVYAVETAKIIIVMCGIMGYKPRIRVQSVIGISCSVIAAVIVSYYTANSLIIGMLSVITVVFMLDGERKLVCGFLSYLSVSMLDVMVSSVTMLLTNISTADYNQELINNSSVSLRRNDYTWSKRHEFKRISRYSCFQTKLCHLITKIKQFSNRNLKSVSNTYQNL